MSRLLNNFFINCTNLWNEDGGCDIHRDFLMTSTCGTTKFQVLKLHKLLSLEKKRNNVKGGAVLVP
jgi:hypothetical protein